MPWPSSWKMDMTSYLCRVWSDLEDTCQADAEWHSDGNAIVKIETGSSNSSVVDWDISPKFGMQVDFASGSRIAMPSPPSWKGYDVITLSLMMRVWQNSAGRCRVICLPKVLDVHFEDAQTDPVHAPKQQIIMKKLDSLQHLIRTSTAKSQN